MIPWEIVLWSKDAFTSRCILSGDEHQLSQDSLSGCCKIPLFLLALTGVRKNWDSPEKWFNCCLVSGGSWQHQWQGGHAGSNPSSTYNSFNPTSSLKHPTSCLAGKPRGFTKAVWDFKGSFPLGNLVWGTWTLIPVGIVCCTFAPITRMWCFRVSRLFSCCLC